MDLLSLLRTLGGLGTVLGILAGALWLVRRYDLRLPGRSITTRDKRLELIETLPIDNRRMVALLRRDGREHLILVAPEGHLIIESGVVRDAVDLAAADARGLARAEAARPREAQRHALGPAMAADSVGALVVQLGKRVAPAVRTLKSRLDRRSRTSGTKDASPGNQQQQTDESFGTLVDRTCPRAAPAWLVLKSLPENLPGPMAAPPPAVASSTTRVRVRKARTVAKERKFA
ncbi:hypothetical protein BH10PSE14_BH10PSE14_24230 [soil metagenome]